MLTLGAADPGADTIGHWSIDWGDGAVQAVDGNPPSVTHAYDGPGHYTIHATASDEDGTFSAAPLGTEYRAGDPDASFGSGGSAVTDFAMPTKVAARDAVAYPDGRVLVLGTTRDNTTYDEPVLARFNADGSPDATFSGDGRLYVPTHSVTAGGTLALLPDGRIVVAGTNGGLTVSAMRFKPDGSPDTTFGVDGVASVITQVPDPGVASPQVNDLVALPGGKLLLAGTINGHMAAVRLNADGSADETFAPRGIVLFPLSPDATTDQAYGAALGPDGRVAIVGTERDIHFNDYLTVAMLRPDGMLDPTFDGDGLLRTAVSRTPPTSESDAGAFAAAFQADGKLLVGGESFFQNWPLLRYNADGSLDPTFDGDGVVTGAWTDGRILSIAALPDGKILAAGWGNQGPSVVRYTAGGALDASFGGGGKITFAGTDAVAVLPVAGGKFFVAGTAQDKLRVERFTPVGQPDATFGAGAAGTGVVAEDRFAPLLGGTARAVFVLSDRKLLAVSPVEATPDLLLLARYLPDGRPDNSFGDFGRVTATAPGTVWDVALAPGDKLVAGAGSSVLRLNSDGTPDTTFGADGVVANALGASGPASRVAVDAQGRVVVAGVGTAAASSHLLVTRLAPGGSADTSFAGTGHYESADNFFGVYSLSLQGDGKVLVGGNGIVRFNADGTPDTTFGGGDGLADLPNPPDLPPDPRFHPALAQGLFVMPDGRILAAATATTGGSAGGFDVARLLPDGSPDPTFGGGDGLAAVPMPNGPDGAATQVALDPQGRILVGGFGSDSSTLLGPRIAALRLLPDGSADLSFGVDGIASVQTVGDAFTNINSSMAVLDTGDVLVGGSDNARHMVLVRFHADDQRQLTVDVRNLPPTADAGPDVAAIPGRPFTLTGAFTDPSPSDAHTFHWKITNASGGTEAEGNTQSITFTPPTTQRYTATFTVTDDDGAASSDTAFVDAAPAVVGRWLFYDNSAYDGHAPGPTRADNAAVATDKRALLPGGTASFANVSGYTRGINGIMIDVAGDMPLTALVGVAMNVDLKTGTGGDPGAWPDAPRPTLISVFPGDGTDGSDRIVLTWPDGAIRNAWLRVTVRDVDFNGGFGLPDDTFLFGNLVGETTGAGSLRMDAFDLRATSAASTGAAGITNVADHNRDGRVNALDVWAVRSNQRRTLTPVALPAAEVAAAPLPPLRRRPAPRDVLGGLLG